MNSPAAANPPLPEPVDREDLRKHLDFLQSTIVRMASASSAAKSWLLPVVTATYGYGLVQHSGGVIWLGIGATILFGFLDAHYLTQEQKFRDLYAIVASPSTAHPGTTIGRFDMNTSVLSPPPPSRRGPVWTRSFRSVLRSWLPSAKAVLSWSIAPFYGAVVIVGVVLYFGAR